MSLGLGKDVEDEALPSEVKLEGTSFWRISLAVFTGLWLFTLSVAVIYALLRATGDLR